MSAPFGQSVFERYVSKVSATFAAPPKRAILSLDFETYSEADLKKVGASRYARHPSTEVLMLAYATSKSEVKQWVPAHGEPIPDDLARALMDPSVTLAAWNAPFEMAIMRHVLGIDIPIWRWMDVMALSFSLALPGGLDQCGKVVGLPQDKQKMSRGKLLVRKFCGPRKPSKHKPHTRCTRETDPEDWAEFLEYNRQDVEAERSIYRKIKAFQMPDGEWALWHLDQKINEAGIPINRDAVAKAIDLANATIARGLAEMEEITGLANANSGAQLLPWLRERGYWFEDLKKGHVEQAANWFRAAFEDGRAALLGYDPAILRVLELRAQVSKSSVKKYPALGLATDDDGNLRGCHQFAGAGRTWRWAGRRFQPQNLSKPAKYLEDSVPECAHDIEHLSIEEMWAKYDDPDRPSRNVMEVLVAGVRPMVQAPEGHLLTDADLSAIENVVLGWLADDHKILRVFELGLDPYIDFAQDMFKLPYDAIAAKVAAGDKSMRTTAKPGVLGCLRGDTPVLTHRGWVRLVEVAHDDLLWDGEEWVSHGGVVFRGRQPVQEIAGVWATPDHKFLTQNGWRETCRLASQPTIFESALATGNGAFSGTKARHGAAAGGSSAGADAAFSASSPDRTSSEDSAPAAPAALPRTVAPRSERQSARTCSTLSQIASTLLGRAARTPRIVPTITTADGAFVCGSRTPTSGSITSSTTSAQTAASKLIGPTTTATTKWETCDWQRGPSRTRTSDTWDVVEAGPRSRFTILTEAGPLIAHNCGYMLGAGEARENPSTGEIEATGLLGYGWGMGVDLTPQMAKLSVDTFRAKFKRVVEFWYELDRACKRAVTSGDRQTCGYLSIDVRGPFMRIRLPSGRHLHYWKPKLLDRKTPWGEVRKQLTYEQVENGQWRRVTTHPGKLTENVTQAVARDILAHGMTLADRRGLDLRMHVHDQAVAVSPAYRAERDLRVLIECLTTRPAWANEKLPLKAAGLTTPVFLKD